MLVFRDTYLVPKKLKRFIKLHETKQGKNVVKIGKWGQQKYSYRRKTELGVRAAFTSLRRFARQTPCSPDSRSRAEPPPAPCVADLSGNECHWCNSSLWDWAEILWKEFHFLIIVKQFYVILWKRPSFLSLCLWPWTEQVMFGALAITLWSWEQQRHWPHALTFLKLLKQCPQLRLLHGRKMHLFLYKPQLI